MTSLFLLSASIIISARTVRRMSAPRQKKKQSEADPLPPHLPPGLFEARHERACAAGQAAAVRDLHVIADVLRMQALQLPAADDVERRRLFGLARDIEGAEAMLATFGAVANERAHALLAQGLGGGAGLPTEARQMLLLPTITRRSRHAMCAHEAYESMLVLHRAMRAVRPDLYARLGELIAFFDGHEELRACVHAHRIALHAAHYVDALGALGALGAEGAEEGGYVLRHTLAPDVGGCRFQLFKII